MVAGNPKIFGQLVALLAPFTSVVARQPAEAATAVVGGAAPVGAAVAAPAPDTPEAALERTFGSAKPPPPADLAEPAPAAPAKRAAVRIRKSELPRPPPPERGAESARRGSRDAPAAKRRGPR